MADGTHNSHGGLRQKTTKVRTARGRKMSSTRWLQRQLNDPYVHRAKKEGYRSRAAYKLVELDEKFSLLKPHHCVVDLGAAPGGWSQVAVKKGCKVIALDILPMEPLGDVTCMQLDFMAEDAPEQLKAAAGGAVNIVMSDMAPNTTGHRKTDHLRIMMLTEAAFTFACEVLARDGVFISKVWQGGTEHQLLHEIKRHFTTVRHAKPKASRADSAEMYLVATGFKL